MSSRRDISNLFIERPIPGDIIRLIDPLVNRDYDLLRSMLHQFIMTALPVASNGMTDLNIFNIEYMVDKLMPAAQRWFKSSFREFLETTAAQDVLDEDVSIYGDLLNYFVEHILFHNWQSLADYMDIGPAWNTICELSSDLGLIVVDYLLTRAIEEGFLPNTASRSDMWKLLNDAYARHHDDAY